MFLHSKCPVNRGTPRLASISKVVGALSKNSFSCSPSEPDTRVEPPGCCVASPRYWVRSRAHRTAATTMRSDTKLKIARRKHTLGLLKWLYSRRSAQLDGTKLSLEYRRSFVDDDTRSLTYGEVSTTVPYAYAMYALLGCVSRYVGLCQLCAVQVNPQSLLCHRCERDVTRSCKHTSLNFKRVSPHTSVEYICACCNSSNSRATHVTQLRTRRQWRCPNSK